jgi:transposase
MQQALYNKRYSRQRPGWKPPLDASSKTQCVAILKQYHLDCFNCLEVVLTDETPAKIVDRRGLFCASAKKDETFHPAVKRARVKRQSEGMVLACFAYSRKGPNKFGYTEEEEEKEAAKSPLQKGNEVRKAAMVLECISRLKEDKKGKLVKKARKLEEAIIYKRNARDRGGIDGYRQWEEVLKPLLMPFVEELKKEGRNVYVLEDNALAHRSDIDTHFFKVTDVVKLLWPPNIPDANAIEQAWPWLRQHIMKDVPYSTTAEECKRQWKQEWENLPFEQINAGIDEIPKRIVKILAQEGDISFHG